jgi:hypothetical protein
MSTSRKSMSFIYQIIHELPEAVKIPKSRKDSSNNGQRTAQPSHFTRTPIFLTTLGDKMRYLGIR